MNDNQPRAERIAEHVRSSFRETHRRDYADQPWDRYWARVRALLKLHGLEGIDDATNNAVNDALDALS